MSDSPFILRPPAGLDAVKRLHPEGPCLCVTCQWLGPPEGQDLGGGGGGFSYFAHFIPVSDMSLSQYLSTCTVMLKQPAHFIPYIL